MVNYIIVWPRMNTIVMLIAATTLLAFLTSLCFKHKALVFLAVLFDLANSTLFLMGGL